MNRRGRRARFYRKLPKEELQKKVFRKQEGSRDGQNGCENLKGDLLAERRIILKQFLQKIRAWNGFILIR
jgi:hypothetical protein